MKQSKFLLITGLFASLISNAQVTEIKNLNQLNSQVLQSGKPAIIKVSATWCGACTRARKPFEALASDPEYTDVIFAEVDADASPDIMKKYDVQSLPTFVYIKNGQEVKKSTGFSDNFKKEMNAEISQLRGGAAAPAPALGAMEKKTEIEGQPEAAETSGTCAAVPSNFFESAYNAIADFFRSIADTVKGWFK